MSSRVGLRVVGEPQSWLGVEDWYIEAITGLRMGRRGEKTAGGGVEKYVGNTEAAYNFLNLLVLHDTNRKLFLYPNS